MPLNIIQCNGRREDGKMILTPVQTIMMIAAIAFGTMLTRFTPFLLFPEKKQPPRVILYLGSVIPCAMMGLLVVYCLRNVSFLSGAHGLPEALAIILIIVLHRWKHHTLLSIGGGTLCYMILVQFVFQ